MNIHGVGADTAVLLYAKNSGGNTLNARGKISGREKIETELSRTFTKSDFTRMIDGKMTPEKVNKAYRKLVTRFHPDRFAGSGEEFSGLAGKRFLEIRDIYFDVLRTAREQESHNLKKETNKSASRTAGEAFLREIEQFLEKANETIRSIIQKGQKNSVSRMGPFLSKILWWFLPGTPGTESSEGKGLKPAHAPPPGDTVNIYV